MNKKIILIDEEDNITGRFGKLSVHKLGLLHRAFSVFIINSKKELLVQKRAVNKYHSGGLWSNTCCSHFTSSSMIQKQAEKRLIDEMGINSHLKWVFNYRYSVKFENGLFENELVYSYLGYSEETPNPNPEEVEEWKWMNINSLKEEMIISPEKYSFWFKFSYPDFSNCIV